MPPSPATGSQTRPVTLPMVETTWPIRTREHVDLWLHSYALLNADTTLVPYFRRGYRERINGVRRNKNAASLIDTNRGKLLDRILNNPSLATSGQFLPLYFSSWEQMKQVIDLFVRNNGNPGNSNDPAMRSYFGLLGAAFQNVGDREWLRMLTEAVDDESRRFYHEYWTGESRSHAAVVARTDSLWQRQWRPSLQRFLNNTQQQNGELYLSLPLGGEGRTVHFGKADNAVAGPMPENNGEAEIVPARRHDWAALPEAAALLADCAARPPATRMVRVTDLTTFHARLHVGARVRKLQAIHRAEGARLFARCEAARNYDAFDAHIRRTVQNAIADALFHAALARSAACDARASGRLERREVGNACEASKGDQHPS